MSLRRDAAETAKKPPSKVRGASLVRWGPGRAAMGA
jgi:hypothetical protein